MNLRRRFELISPTKCHPHLIRALELALAFAIIWWGWALLQQLSRSNLARYTQSMSWHQSLMEQSPAKIARDEKSRYITSLNDKYQDAFNSINVATGTSLSTLRDRELATLPGRSPIRYCGSFFEYQQHPAEGGPYAPNEHENLDCPEFADGPSIVHVLSRSTTTFPTGYDETTTTYGVGDITIVVRETDAPKAYLMSCHVSIQERGRPIYTLPETAGRCSPMQSIEYAGRLLLPLQYPYDGSNREAWPTTLLYFDGHRMHDLGSMTAAFGPSVENYWVSVDGDFMVRWYDGSYEMASVASHAASTVAFVPRVFRIADHKGSIVVTEGPAISKAVHAAYAAELHGIRSTFLAVFDEAKPDELWDGMGYDAYLTYWIGIARYLLHGQALNDELATIEKIAKKYGIHFPESRLLDVYADIGNGLYR